MDRTAEWKWLYVMACKGIQDFIFRSDKLKQMIGASELIEEIPDDFLDSVLRELGVADDGRRVLTRAAGAARILFRSEADARALARLFPLAVGEKAPGLELVQALVQVKNGLFSAMEEAEGQLRARRNLPSATLPPAGPLVQRNRRSGLPAETIMGVGWEGDEAVDRETARKLETVRRSSAALVRKVAPGKTADEIDRWPLNFEEIVARENAYLGIVHADANGLGRVIIDLASTAPADFARSISVYEGFSRGIAAAAERAAREALAPILRDTPAGAKFPVRPIVCAGDDLTIVIRASDAIRFTSSYLQNFEQFSAEEMGRLGVPGLPTLTACAGIAFVKKSFPFAQGYELCESLCKHAKTAVSRKLSAVSFWRQTTASGSHYASVLDRELTVGELCLTMCPYRVGQGSDGTAPLLSDLEDLSKIIKEEFPKGSLRNVVSSAYESYEAAQRDYEKLCQVAEDREKGKAELLNDALRKITGNSAKPLWRDNGTGRRMDTPLLDALELLAMDSAV